MSELPGIVEEVPPPKKEKVIPLSKADYAELERMMQWPEDLPKYDKLNKPTPLTEIGF